MGDRGNREVRGGRRSRSAALITPEKRGDERGRHVIERGFTTIHAF
jgi:hypothetical protein